MRKIVLTVVFFLSMGVLTFANDIVVNSPDGKLVVKIAGQDGKVYYSISYNGFQMMEPSALGLITDTGNLSEELSLTSHDTKVIDETYAMRTTKVSSSHYIANQLNLTYENGKKQQLIVTFQVSDNNVAFRYTLPKQGSVSSIVIKEEATSFRLPNRTTTFISPQSKPMTGWMRAKPSYAEEYVPDALLTDPSKYGEGYTFPCLFHVANNGWVLVSETGTSGAYAGCHLSDYSTEKGYQIAFPMEGESNGVGTADVGLALPGSTPWRTVTVGTTLKPIVETTVPYDVVKPLYEPSQQYQYGRYTWSWLLWQDNSANYEDQVQFINLASAMGYEYTLVDALWDQQMGYERMGDLARYAQQKGVGLLLWYNSNGFANDTPQTPKHRMDNAIARKREMAWMKSIGIKGIKVDFFGGDKQHTLQLYEDILSDANDFGLQVIFHGCTLPRGWERMYPNFISSEAVLASENIYFSQHHAEREAYELTIHPFCRNAVAAMDWGGTIMNRYMSRDNKSRHHRYTTDIFEIASAVINQCSVQCIAMQPNNLDELPQMEIKLLKQIPTTWDETRFIDGYPGKYVVMARRHGSDWYIAGLNATTTELKLTLNLPMLVGKTVHCYTDKPFKDVMQSQSQHQLVKIGKKGLVKATLQPNGGMVIGI